MVDILLLSGCQKEKEKNIIILKMRLEIIELQPLPSTIDSVRS